MRVGTWSSSPRVAGLPMVGPSPSAAPPPTSPVVPTGPWCRSTFMAPAMSCPRLPTRERLRPAVQGTEGRHGGQLRRSPISVLFGAPLTPDEGENAHRFSARVEGAVASLSREVHADWWQARRAVSVVDPTDGAERTHRGPDAPAWRRAWALDTRPLNDGARWPE